MVKIYCMPRGEKSGSEMVYALLGHAYNIHFREVLPVIEKTPNGKPYFPERSDIHFSLSHARTHVLCALSDKPVGADIESPRPISLRARRFFCSDAELELFDPLDLWVLKESYIKLHGLTLASMNEFRFSRDGARIIAPDVSVNSSLYHFDGCSAAVCVMGEPPPESIELLPLILTRPGRRCNCVPQA